MEWFNWHERADKRDKEARQIADAKAIQDAAKRLEERRVTGTELRYQVQSHFLKKDENGEIIPYVFESTQAALNTLKAAAALEREGDGLPDFVVMALNADSEQIQRKRNEIFAELERRKRERGGDDSLLDGDGRPGAEDD